MKYQSSHHVGDLRLLLLHEYYCISTASFILSYIVHSLRITRSSDVHPVPRTVPLNPSRAFLRVPLPLGLDLSPIDFLSLSLNLAGHSHISRLPSACGASSRSTTI